MRGVGPKKSAVTAAAALPSTASRGACSWRSVGVDVAHEEDVPATIGAGQVSDPHRGGNAVLGGIVFDGDDREGIDVDCERGHCFTPGSTPRALTWPRRVPQVDPAKAKEGAVLPRDRRRLPRMARASTPPGPRWLYLHGFASGPGSHKAVVLAEHYQRQGIALERLDLRVPSLERLRMEAMLAVVHGALGSARDRAVVFGSSRGGLTACRVAEEDARVAALVLLAPAFCFLDRWRQRLGEEGWRRWEATDVLAIHDYAAQRETTVDFGFARSVAAIDAERGPWPDVRVPTLIVHGRQDDVVDIAVSREFAHGRLHVRLIEVDDGHELGGSLPLIAAAADEFLGGWRTGAQQ